MGSWRRRGCRPTYATSWPTRSRAPCAIPPPPRSWRIRAHSRWATRPPNSASRSRPKKTAGARSSPRPASSCSRRPRGGRPGPSVHVAPVAVGPAQAGQAFFAQYRGQRLVHALRHALQAAAYVDIGAGPYPRGHVGRGIGKRMLHVAPCRRIAREHGVQALQPALREPSLDLGAVEPVMLGLALAEHEPVAVMAGRDARLGQGAQAGKAGAVADQKQWPSVGGRVEVRVRAQAQVYGVAWLRQFGQPAAAWAQSALCVAHLPHQQVERAVRWHRCNGISAVWQQCAAAAIARTDFRDIARRPGRWLAQWLEFQMEAGPALATRVQQAAPCQAPGLISWRFPIGQAGAPGQLAKVALPVAQGCRVGFVGLDAVEQRPCAVLAQPDVNLPAKSTEMAIAAVAQRQHGITQVS